MSRLIVAGMASRFDLRSIDTTQAAGHGDFNRVSLRKITAAFGLLRDAARGLRPGDLAYINLTPHGFALVRDLLLLALLRLGRARVTAHVHVPARSALANWVLRRAARACRIVAVCPEIADDLAAAPDLRVMLNATPDRGAGASEPAAVARRFAGRQLLFASNLRIGKGFAEAVRLHAGASARLSDLRLAVAGAVHDEATAAELEAALRDVQRIDRRGPLDASGMDALYRESAVLLLPSAPRSEGCPMVVIEALMHGVPVVMTAMAAAATVVDGNGLVHDPSDSARTVAYLVELLSDPAAYARAARRSRELYERHFVFDHYLARLVDAVEA
jgi:glycosyltransferase involved in cell wall biosynthesis